MTGTSDAKPILRSFENHVVLVFTVVFYVT
jgi:hypothetical protein